MQLEQEQFAWLQRTEIRCGWRPEIDFAEAWLPAENLEPIVVSNGDYEFNAHHGHRR